MSLETYRRNLRSPIRGLWSGVIDSNQFFDAMETAIRRGLTEAWQAGAGECGIGPDELTPEELNELNAAIFSELNHIDGLATAISENGKDSGGNLAPFLSRTELWVNRYRDLQNRARVLACEDQKLEWVIGQTEEHCTTCPRLNGQVRRASYWLDVGIVPQNPPNPDLECGGWKCLCEQKPTKKPVSRGRLPRTP